MAELQVTLAEKTLIKKLYASNGLLNLKFKGEQLLTDNVAKVKTRFSRLAAASDPVSESTQAAVLLSSLSNALGYADITASRNQKKRKRQLGTTLH